MLYSIASIIVEADCLPVNFASFQLRVGEIQGVTPDVRIYRGGDAVSVKGYSLVEEHASVRIWMSDKSAESYKWIYEMKNGFVAMKVSSDYSFACVYDKTTNAEVGYSSSIDQLLQILIECRLVSKGLIILHAACVRIHGQAIAFTGNSGIGKSTRALAWVKSVGAEWISGDRPAIGPIEQKAYGLPWDGKEKIYLSTECPVKAILQVKRSNRTYMRQLSYIQRKQFLLTQIFIPMWDSSLVARAVLSLKHLLLNISVYAFYGDESEKSALEAHDILFSNSNLIRDALEVRSMRIKRGFELVEIAGEYMVIPVGDNMAVYGGTVVMNDVSAFIFRRLSDGITREDLLDNILNEYDISEEIAQSDLDKTLCSFRELGLLE